MAFPLPSDFTSADANAAWWGYARDNGAVNYCATTGAAFLRQLRGSLSLAAAPVWDADLQAALIAQATDLQTLQGSAWTPLVSALQSDLAARRVSRSALSFALYLAYYRSAGLRLDAINVIDGTVMPRWGASVPDVSDSPLVCWDPQADDEPWHNPATVDAAAQESLNGIRLHQGESLPAPTNAPPGIEGASPLIVGLFTVAALGGIYWFLMTTGSGSPRPKAAVKRMRRK